MKGAAPLSLDNKLPLYGSPPLRCCSVTRKLHPLVDLQYDRSTLDELQNRIAKNGPWDDWTLFQLSMEAEQAKRIDSFEQLQCLRSLPMLEPMPPPNSTARKVLHEMGGRAILADEVGLGKTIEAGLILKEYMSAGSCAKYAHPCSRLARAAMGARTESEIRHSRRCAEKSPYVAAYDIIVASMDTAKRDPHRDIILGTDYDMLIVDEAHKLKNKKTTNYQFVNRAAQKILPAAYRNAGAKRSWTSCTT